MIEIGNYDGFYGEGRIFTAEEVLRLTRETRSLLGARVPLSVTVPHTLALAEQVSHMLFACARGCIVRIPDCNAGFARSRPRVCWCKHHPDRGWYVKHDILNIMMD
jgi:hypothetical protein